MRLAHSTRSQRTSTPRAAKPNTHSFGSTPRSRRDRAEAAAAQRFSKQLKQAAEFRFRDLLDPDVINPLRAAASDVREHLTWSSPILRHALRLAAAVDWGRPTVRADRARLLDSADGLDGA